MTEGNPRTEEDTTDTGPISQTAQNGIDGSSVTVPYHVKGTVDDSTNGASGIIGRATANSGATYGVTATTDSLDRGAAGVYGFARNNVLGSGVEGYISSSKDGSRGVYGHTGAGVAVESYGVEGKTIADGDVDTDKSPAGVYGRTTGDGPVHGVRGKTTSSDGVGVYGNASDSGGHGVYSDGDTHVAGTLTAEERSITNSGVSAYHSFEQSIEDTTETKIDFDLVLYNDRQSYDTATNEFVAPTDGRYDVTVAALPEAYGSKATVEAKVNGNTRVWNQQSATTGSLPHPIAKKTLELSKGDTVVPYVWHNAGDSVSLVADESTTYLTITQVA